MVNFSKVGTLIKANSKGQYVQSKMLKLPFANLAMSGIKAPANTATCDIVTIANKSTPETTEIMSLRDSAGKLLKRITSKDTGDIKNSVSTKEYTYYNFCNNNTRIVDEKLLQYKDSGKLLKTTSQDILYTVTPNEKAVVSRAKLQSNGNEKTLIYGEYKNGQAPKYFKANFTDNNGVQTLNSTASQGVNEAEILKDPYALIRLYDNNNFAKSIMNIAKKRQNVEGNIKYKVTPLKNELGYYQPGTKSIKIDNDLDFKPKTQIVNTVNHEYRHAHQYEVAGSIFKKNNSKNKAKLAKRWFFENLTYPLTTFTHKGYRNNPLEKDARKAGTLAEKAYSRSADKICKEFDYLCAEQLGLSNIKMNAEIKNLNSKSVDIGLFD